MQYWTTNVTCYGLQYISRYLRGDVGGSRRDFHFQKRKLWERDCVVCMTWYFFQVNCFSVYIFDVHFSYWIAYSQIIFKKLFVKHADFIWNTVMGELLDLLRPFPTTVAFLVLVSRAVSKKSNRFNVFASWVCLVFMF